MKVKVEFTEEWSRVEEVDVDEDWLAEWAGHGPPFMVTEVIDFLDDTACQDDTAWTVGVRNLDFHRDDFAGISVYDVTSEELLADERPKISVPRLREVQDVVKTL